jgi:hypothetical protein
MWSAFEGDKDVFEGDCTLSERVIFVVTSLLSRRRRTENLWKWAVQMILGGIVPESCDLCCMLHIRFWRFLFLYKTITDTLYLNIPENFLIPQSTECSPQRNVVFQPDSALPHFQVNVRFSGCRIPRSAERASCAISVVFSFTGFDASGRFLWEIINHPKNWVHTKHV